VLPLWNASVGLGTNVRSHSGGRLVDELHMSRCDNVVEPRYGDSLGTIDVSHGRVLARLHNMHRSGIVLAEDERGFTAEDNVEMIQRKQRHHTQARCRCHQFRFWRRVSGTSLPLAQDTDGKTSVRSNHE
jgi:hypothetical protein